MQAFLLCQHADETAILGLVLQRAGYSARTARDLDYAIQNWPENPIEFSLLAFRGEVDLTRVRQLRAQSAAPLLVILDPAPEEVHLSLWESGVDLVVCRPYSATLLVAQVRSLTQRMAGVTLFNLPTLQRCALALNPSTRMVQYGEEPPVALTRLEFRLLYTLMMHPGQVFPAENLIEHVWGYTGEGDRNLVRGLIKRLRAKVEPNSGEPQFILTHPGVGYYFNREG